MIRPEARARLLTAVALIVALLAATSSVDETLHDWAFRHVVSHETLHDWAFRHVVSHEERLLANGFTMLGATEVAVAGLAALAVVARSTADPALWQASVGGVVAVLAGGLGTQIVKAIACRARPRLVDGWGIGDAAPPEAPDRRGFFHWPCVVDGRYQSFPSGHAATAFAVAAALSGWAPAPRRFLVLAAVGVGVSRVVLNAHFLSDVLAGASIGWWAGQWGLRVARDRLAGLWPVRRSTTQGASTG